MKKLILAAALITAAFSAQATAVVSDVSYNAKSITFTETGDLSGYATPSTTAGQFGIAYSGNLLAATGQQLNIVQGHLLAGDTPGIGYTGGFGLSVDYTWLLDSGTVFSATPFTISWTNTELNTLGTGVFTFFWGGGYNGASGFTVLNSVNVINGVVQNAGTVPEPGSVALMGLALAGMLAARRARKG